MEDTIGPSLLSHIERRSEIDFVHSSMWLGLQTVSSLERCPLVRVSFIERFHCSQIRDWLTLRAVPRRRLCISQQRLKVVDEPFVCSWCVSIHHGNLPSNRSPRLPLIYLTTRVLYTGMCAFLSSLLPIVVGWVSGDRCKPV